MAKQIISRTLKAAAKKSGQISGEPRMWTDASGKFKVEASFVRKAGTDVVLKTDAGKELQLAISKLCKEDQELLAGLNDEDVNPFAR